MESSIGVLHNFCYTSETPQHVSTRVSQHLSTDAGPLTFTTFFTGLRTSLLG